MSFMSRRADLSLVAAAKAVTFFGDELATLTLLLRAQPSGPTAVTGVLVANLAPIALLSGAAGRLVDRYDNRRLVVACSAVQAGLCVLLALTSSFPAALELVMLLGAGQALNGTAWQALVPALVPPERLASALGRVQAATTLAGITAPAAGGVLVGTFGTRVPLLVDATTFVAVGVLALLVRTRRTVHRHHDRTDGGLAIVRRDPVLRPALVLLGLFVLLGAMVNVVEVFLVRVTLHASPTWYGLVCAGNAVGLLLGVTVAGRTLTTASARARALVASAAALATGLVLIGLSPDVGAVLAACLLTGCANGVLNVASGALVLGRAREEERGRVGAVLTGVVSTTQLTALAAGGALAAVLSPRTVFVLGGTLGLLAPALLGRRLVAATRPAADRPAALPVLV